MREITDIDMYELAKAAAYIPVYTRDLTIDVNAKPPKTDPGHFSCAEGVGNLALTRNYTTFYLYDAMAEEGSDGFMCSFVLSFQDAFFAQNPYNMFLGMRRDKIGFGSPYDSWFDSHDLDSHPSVYVRIFFDGVIEKHINASVNLAEFIGENYPDTKSIVAWQIPSWNVPGIYANPNHRKYSYDLDLFYAYDLMYLERLSNEVGIPIANKINLKPVKPLNAPKEPEKKALSPHTAQALISQWNAANTNESISAAEFNDLFVITEPSPDGPGWQYIGDE